MKLVCLFLAFTIGADAGLIPKKITKKAAPEPSMLDKYVNSAMKVPAAPPPEPQPGALWSPNARFNDFDTH